MRLQAVSELGLINDSALPTIDVKFVVQPNSDLLAVLFDSQSLDNSDLYPNFITKNPAQLALCQRDFLWEKTCYELFLAMDNTDNSPYLEINFSPIGEFNIYQFEGYRTPSSLPPRRLPISQSQRQVFFNGCSIAPKTNALFWQTPSDSQQAAQDFIAKTLPIDDATYRLVMLIDLKLLKNFLNHQRRPRLWLNPCVVFNNQANSQNYFAAQHANPPDFHAKAYWLSPFS